MISLRKLLGQVAAGMPGLLLLSLVIIALHPLELFQASEGFFMRRAIEIDAERKAARLEFERDTPAQRQIHIIEVSPYARITELESDENMLTAEIVDRVGGVRPIDRKKFALFLEQISDQLALISTEARPKVIALDVDIAPLESMTGTEDMREMRAALLRLRGLSTVVAVVLDRESTSGRAMRNKFMADADCEDGKSKKKSVEALNSLYFASPRVFHNHYSYPLTYPYSVKKSALDTRERSMSLSDSDYFPSLGNLVGLLARPMSLEQHYQALSALTLLCRQARAAPGGEVPLLEDEFAQQPEHGNGSVSRQQVYLNRFDHLYINWRWLDTAFVRNFPLTNLGTRKLEETVDGDTKRKMDQDLLLSALRAQVVIIAVDGGQGHDKFNVAAMSPDAVSGASLHALQALSSDPDLSLNTNSPLAVLADLFLGLLVLIVLKVCLALTGRLSNLPVCEGFIKALTPASIALLAGWFSHLYVSPAFLAYDIWVNPVYIFLGLGIDAYLVASRDRDGEKEECIESPNFTFGLFHFLDACRREAPVEGADLNASRPARWDKLLSTAVQCTIVVLASISLWRWNDLGSYWHQSRWLLLPLALVVGASFYRQIKRSK